MTYWPCHFEPVSGAPEKERVTTGTTPFPTAKKQIEKQKGAGDPVPSSAPSLPKSNFLPLEQQAADQAGTHGP